jgi:hypothetical protein
VKHKDKLNPECGQEVFRQQLEADDDIRLNRPLFEKCLADKKQYCGDVAPGHAAVRDCLVQHRGQPGFSQPCRWVGVCVCVCWGGAWEKQSGSVGGKKGGGEPGVGCWGAQQKGQGRGQDACPPHTQFGCRLTYTHLPPPKKTGRSWRR